MQNAVGWPLVVLGACLSPLLLLQLHQWLVHFQVQFKALDLTFKALYGLGPKHQGNHLLSYELHHLQGGEAVASAAFGWSHIAGNEAFSATSVLLWNSFLVELKTALPWGVGQVAENFFFIYPFCPNFLLFLPLFYNVNFNCIYCVWMTLNA